MSRCQQPPPPKKRLAWATLTAVLLLCAFATLMMGFYLSGVLGIDWAGFVGLLIASGLVFFASEAEKEGRV